MHHLPELESHDPSPAFLARFDPESWLDGYVKDAALIRTNVAHGDYEVAEERLDDLADDVRTNLDPSMPEWALLLSWIGEERDAVKDAVHEKRYGFTWTERMGY